MVPHQQAVQSRVGTALALSVKQVSQYQPSKPSLSGRDGGWGVGIDPGFWELGSGSPWRCDQPTTIGNSAETPGPSP